MKKAMRKLRQKIADEIAVMQAEQVPVGDWGEIPCITPRGIQAGNIAAFEVVLKWIDEITGGKMNIDELEAGRELDAMIAKRVMGWNQVYYHGDELLGLPPETTAIWGENTAPYLLPVLGYSTDIEAAWKVIIQVDARFSVDTSLTTGQFWYAKFEDRGDGTWQDEVVVRAAGSTAPLAICRAALKFTEAMEGNNADREPLD